MKITGCTALVTGSNQGIGEGFVRELLRRGAKRVYATARRPESLDALLGLDPARVVRVKLDITDADHRANAASIARDVTVLINNAGIQGSEDADERRFLSASSLDDARLVMETNCFAQAEMCRSFAPALVANAPAAIVNILSTGALYCAPNYAFYCVAKAAAAIMTQGIRAELKSKNVLVSGVFTSTVVSRMSRNTKGTKMSATDHAEQVLTAVEAGEEDIYAGANVETVVAAFRKDPKAYERQLIASYEASLAEG